MTQSTNPGFGAPPPFQPVHKIECISVKDSKITNVSVYTGRAEVTRLFKLMVKTGQNHVTVNGLPNALQKDSLRVEGRGAATIHDVTISNIPRPAPTSTSPILESLQTEKARKLKALERCKKSQASIDAYLASLSVQHIDVPQLEKVLQGYESMGEKLDDRTLELEQSLKSIQEKIMQEQMDLKGENVNEKLNRRAIIGVFAESEGEVEISLIYAVNGASWDATYDIRVDTQSKEEPVTLLYKASIVQNTGENWSDFPLTLETATPTFGAGIPTLNPWNLSIYKPTPPMAFAQSFIIPPSAAAPPIWIAPESSSVNREGEVEGEDSTSEDEEDTLRKPRSRMAHRVLAVSSKGNISATFEVPGLITIPSDNTAHNVTIVKLKLSAAMSWVCVPKKDMKVHLKAKIKNASEYTLLRGNASVYVNGSFISKSQVPSVSPDESFDCQLGLDPSIRVTYHPRIKKASSSGFYNKSSKQIFSQTVTIFNTKSVTVNDVKIVEQLPVSQDSQIVVKLISPALPTENTSDGGSLTRPVAVAEGIIAQWDEADEPDVPVSSLGKHGKFNWICALPAQAKANLVLQWEVTVPLHADVVGLASSR